MKLEKAKLITMIADEALQDRLVSELKSMNVKGYTISEAKGEGINNEHLTSWEGKNIRLESLVSEGKALKIFQIISEKYLEKYPMVIFMNDVEVIRKERFN